MIFYIKFIRVNYLLLKKERERQTKKLIRKKERPDLRMSQINLNIKKKKKFTLF